MDLRHLDTLILVGGLGTRLQSVLGTGLPKPLAAIKGRPFLAYQLEFLARQGISRVVLATGFLSQVVERSIEDIRPAGMSIELSVEKEPLGTAGAIRHARPMLTSDPVLVLNGDSICSIPILPMLLFHQASKAFITDLLVRMDDTSRYGSVKIDANDQVIHFQEKTDGSPGLINAGVYLLSQACLDRLPDQIPCSLEHDVLSEWTGRGIFGFITRGSFIDIGTPESYAEAERFFAEW